MKRIEFLLAVGAVLLTSALGAAAQSDSLGDYARAARQEKHLPAKKIYTNDNLPTTVAISVVGPAVEIAEEKPAGKLQDEKQSPPQKDSKTEEKKTSQDEQGWRDQLSGQKKKVADLEHELDLLEREFKLRVADYYADAGTQLRDQKKWADEDAKSRADIAEKRQQVEEAKTHLQEMEEEARKAGVQSSASE